MNNQGISIYIAVITMTIILTIALGISAILISQIKTMQEMGNSVISFYAADTGIERSLFEGGEVSGILDNGASYDVQLTLPGPQCSGQSYCLKSIGVYKETRRAIEIVR
tara:strand:+ start:14227 stop:14553 length:327 start_codon:yes stop_codon:yes gene_type:complete